MDTEALLSHAKGLPGGVQKLAMLGAAAFLTYFVYALATKGFKGVASAAAEGVVRAATDTAAGVVIGAGKAIGIPETNEQQCYDAVATGRTWDASFACPAGTFIKSIFGVKPPPPGGLNDLTADDLVSVGLPLAAVTLVAMSLNRGRK